MENTKGTFHAKMGKIKNRNGKHLTEAEEIKKLQKYREMYKKKKIFMTQKTIMMWPLP